MRPKLLDENGKALLQFLAYYIASGLLSVTGLLLLARLAS
jgi:hypothetical protein